MKKGREWGGGGRYFHTPTPHSKISMEVLEISLHISFIAILFIALNFNPSIKDNKILIV